jgi:hypothetical protein
MLGVLLEDGACFGGEFGSSDAWLGLEAFLSGPGKGVEFGRQRLEAIHYASSRVGSAVKDRKQT